MIAATLAHIDEFLSGLLSATITSLKVYADVIVDTYSAGS